MVSVSIVKQDPHLSEYEDPEVLFFFTISKYKCNIEKRDLILFHCFRFISYRVQAAMGLTKSQ